MDIKNWKVVFLNEKQIYNEKILNSRMLYNNQAEHILIFYDRVYFYKKLL